MKRRATPAEGLEAVYPPPGDINSLASLSSPNITRRTGMRKSSRWGTRAEFSSAEGMCTPGSCPLLLLGLVSAR